MSAGLPAFGNWQAGADVWVRSGWRVAENVVTGAACLRDHRGKTVLRGQVEECVAVGKRLASLSGRISAVILLHGLGRDRRCMVRLERAAAEAGYAVANVLYPSLRRPLAAQVAQVRGVARGLMDDGATEINFIGYSLGGLVARCVMAEGVGVPGRLITIGTPNQGASIADYLLRFAAYRGFYGPCGAAVSRGQATRLPIPAVEIGVMAGGNGRQGYNPLLAGDNDGLVTAAEARLGPHEADFLLTPAIHGLLPTDRRVVANTLAFLAAGRFSQ